MTIRTRFAVFGLAALIPVACSDVNPSGPSVSFTAPTASGPSNGSSYRFNQQPITLTINNAVRSGAAVATYNVEVATNSSFATIVQTKDGIAEGAGSTTTVQISGLTGGATYFWRWRAVVDGVVGQPSQTLSFAVSARVILGVPDAEQPQANTEVYTATPTFTVRNGSRSGPIGSITYDFEVSTVSTFATTVAKVSGIPEGNTRTSWTPTAQLPEASLFWRARSVDATNGEVSPYTNPVRFDRKEGIDLTKVIYQLGPDMTTFEETAVITDAYHSDGQLCIFHTRLGLWPVTDFFDAGPILEGNQEIFVNIGGQWYAGSADWYRPGQACKNVDEGIAADSFVGKFPISTWRPQPGEVFGVMATTPARAYPAMKTYDERTNVKLIKW